MQQKMTHFFFFGLLISFALGVGVVFLFVSLNNRLKQPLLRHFLMVLICLGLAVFSDIFTVYFSLVLQSSSQLLASLIVFSGVFYHLMMGGLVYALPHFRG